MLNLDLPEPDAPEDSDNDYLVSLDQNGVHIESPEIVKKLERVNLSASTITGLESCPARWVFEKYVKPEILPEDDDTPAKRGSVFHDIMEEFFRIEPPEARTMPKLSEITKTIITTKYPEFANNSEVILWVKDAIKGYYKMGGSPHRVVIADVPSHKDPSVEEKGLEIFVKGRIGEATRDTLGFIDQVLDSTKGGEKSVVVSDWKSGKHKEFTKTKRFRDGNNDVDGFAEVRQQIIYSMLIEQKDVNVSSARLIYPIAGKIADVDVNDDELRVRVVKSVEEADKTLTSSIENNTFEFGPSFLCSWCPLVKICPQANLKPFKKAVDARAQQPTPEELAKGVRFK